MENIIIYGNNYSDAIYVFLLHMIIDTNGSVYNPIMQG